MTETTQYKCVLSPAIARRLLRLGYCIRDIKPFRGDSTRRQSVFLFEVSDGFMEDLRKLQDEPALTTKDVAEHGVELGVMD